MADIVKSIWDFAQWAYNEYEDYNDCKEEILELKMDVKQMCIMLEEYGERLECSSSNKKTIYHALHQLNQTVDSSQQIHIKFSQKYKKKYQVWISILFNRTKRHVMQITACRDNLQRKITNLQMALQVTTYVDGNQAVNQEDDSGNNSVDSSAWEISYNDIEFKLDKRDNRKSLGSGSFATVYDATIKEEPVAVKEFHINLNIWKNQKKRKDFQKAFKREVNNLIRLNHPNIVDFIGAIADDSEDEPAFMIIVEKLSKTVADISHEMTFEDKLQIIIQIAYGVAYMHSLSIIHRDIKPDNIMLSEDGIPKLIDFGLSKEKEDHQRTQSTGGISGTPLWLSPERKRGKPSTSKSDVYSLGLVIANLLTGTLPSRDLSPIIIYKEALKEATGNNKDFCDLVLQCLDEKPEKRPIAEELHFELKSILRKLSCSQIEEETAATNVCEIANDSPTDENAASVISRIKSMSVNDIVEILILMKMYEHSALVQSEACFVLANIMANHPKHKVDVYKQGGIDIKGGIDIIITSLQNFSSNKQVQENGLFALGNIMFGHPNHRVDVYNRGGIDIIITSLQNFSSNELVHKYGLLALANIMSGHPKHKVDVYNRGGIDIIITSLQHFSSNEHVQRNGLLALANISYKQPEHARKIVSLNGVELIRKAMKRFPNHEFIQEYGYFALKNIQGGQGTKAQNKNSSR